MVRIRVLQCEAVNCMFFLIKLHICHELNYESGWMGGFVIVWQVWMLWKIQNTEARFVHLFINSVLLLDRTVEVQTILSPYICSGFSKETLRLFPNQSRVSFPSVSPGSAPRPPPDEMYSKHLLEGTRTLCSNHFSCFLIICSQNSSPDLFNSSANINVLLCFIIKPKLKTGSSAQEVEILSECRWHLNYIWYCWNKKYILPKILSLKLIIYKVGPIN